MTKHWLASEADAEWRPNQPLPSREAGVNSRLDEMQAAILRARLPIPCRVDERRRELAGAVPHSLAGSRSTVPPPIRSGHVYHLFVVRAAAS
jgi:dTDP-4-amino-4,6-dideoxygalactose transaminase